MSAYPPNHGADAACRSFRLTESSEGRDLAIDRQSASARSSDRPAAGAELDDLVEKMRAIEAGRRINVAAMVAPSGESAAHRTAALSQASARSTGLMVPLTQSLGLPRGMVHEWLSGSYEAFEGSPDSVTPGLVDNAPPPLCLFSELAWRAISPACDPDDQTSAIQPGHVLWIGRSVWPWPRVLLRDRPSPCSLLQRSWFIDPPDRAARLWAMELALGNPAVTVVIGDGRGFERVATRRLQLAARAGQSLCLLARPYAERRTLSAAATRWGVAPRDSPTAHPRWIVRLLRCKAAIEAFTCSHSNADYRLEMEWTGDQGLVCQPASLADRTDSTPRVSVGPAIEPAQKPIRRRA
jgi:hypothetical protein